ncbi:peptidoglycan-binding domain-containing protein [Virgibacillus halophilus]|uniref:Peptidoglycan-binding domain-containing protein n=1 Tax=Tigheibacillus halophilus TaxID=361280 RepID=A0ABU5CB99_9BACI|nr:peptidoglycan-binding domain-containing protein [Virgibacillus halophilus]
MISETMENVVKQTILYSFVLSQPFIFNGEVTMAAQKSFDQHKNRLAISNHSKSSRFLQQKLSTLPEHHKISDFSIVIDRHISKLEGNNKQADGMKMNADAKSVFSREASLKKREQQKIEQLAKEIQPGMQNDKVKKVQLALRHFGYYEGEIDGIYGPMTGQALHIAKEEQHLSIPDHPNSITLKETPRRKKYAA